MIHQSDVLVFNEIVDRGDGYCVMVAMEDKYVRDGSGSFPQELYQMNRNVA